MSIPLKPLGLTLGLSLCLAGCLESMSDADAVDAVPSPSPVAGHAAHAQVEPADAMDTGAPQLQAAMRDLWRGHIVSARDYVLAVHAGNEADASAAADAVVGNARDISAAVAGFYGEAGGDRMLALLGGHWGAVKALTDARADDEQASAQSAMDELTANAGEIAAFLASANPNLPEDTVRGLLLAHGAHHSQQIDLILADDTAGEAAEWTAMQAHMDTIADALASAIAKQFPDKAA